MKVKNFFLFTILVSSFAFAQQKPSFGINAGTTYSTVRGNNADNGYRKFDYDADFLVGISAEIPMSKKWSVIANVNYERKSFKETIMMRDFTFNVAGDPVFYLEDFTIDERFSYLAVPLNVKYYIGGKKNFFVNGGLYTAFFLGSESSYEGKRQHWDDSEINAVDLGVDLGTGFVLKINEKNKLNIEIRDNLGLSNNSKFANSEFKTNNFNLILNWQFTL